MHTRSWKCLKAAPSSTSSENQTSEHPAVASTGAVGGPDRAGSFEPFEMIFAESVTGHCLLDPLRPFWTCSSLLPNRCERNAQKHPKAWNKDLEVPHLAWITRENHIQTWTRWKHVKIMDTFFWRRKWGFAVSQLLAGPTVAPISTASSHLGWVELENLLLLPRARSGHVPESQREIYLSNGTLSCPITIIIPDPIISNPQFTLGLSDLHSPVMEVAIW